MSSVLNQFVFLLIVIGGSGSSVQDSTRARDHPRVSDEQHEGIYELLQRSDPGSIEATVSARNFCMH